MRLWSFIREAMLRYPNQVISENDASLSYEYIVAFAEQFSQRLKKEKSCAILCSSEMASAMALLSCFAAGVTAIPLSFRYGSIHCNKILNRIQPSAVITDIDGGLNILNVSDFCYKEPEESPALIMCTSGTTGTPKGVMLSEQNIQTNVKDICEYFKLSSKDSIFITRPLYHCAVLTGEFLSALMSGCQIRFYSGQFHPKEILESIEKHQMSVFCGTPTMLSLMARIRKKENLSCLKKIAISGECMSKEAGKRIAQAFPNAAIYHVYGLTEACPRVSWLPPKLFLENADAVGIPLFSVTLKILKENNSPATQGESGMLWIKGANVMLGYYDDPQATERVLKKGWLCTGDIAMIDEHGLLKIKGRSDDLIIRGGMNIYPAEVESALKMDDRVKEVFVYSFVHPLTGVELGMKISGDFNSKEEIQKICAEYLPSYQRPSKIELVDELPKSSSGKIIRRRST